MCAPDCDMCRWCQHVGPDGYGDRAAATESEIDEFAAALRRDPQPYVPQPPRRPRKLDQ